MGATARRAARSRALSTSRGHHRNREEHPMHERPPVAEDAEPARPAAADLTPPPFEIETPASPTALRRLARLAAGGIGPLRRPPGHPPLYIGGPISLFCRMITLVAGPSPAY